MKFVYKGKYNGDENSLPQRKHPKGYVPYKEPDMDEFSKRLGLMAFFVLVVFLIIAWARSGEVLISFIADSGKDTVQGFAGLIAAVITMVPHEFLHAICFKEDVEMYENLKKGMLFVVGTEDMSRSRFIFMCMLPNLVFGFLPFIIYMIDPKIIFAGVMGVFNIAAGAGDYYNVFNTLVQVPRGAKVYMSGDHTFWHR